MFDHSPLANHQMHTATSTIERTCENDVWHFAGIASLCRSVYTGQSARIYTWSLMPQRLLFTTDVQMALSLNILHV
jgi:hypothetical protein